MRINQHHPALSIIIDYASQTTLVLFRCDAQGTLAHCCTNLSVIWDGKYSIGWEHPIGVHTMFYIDQKLGCILQLCQECAKSFPRVGSEPLYFAFQ